MQRPFMFGTQTTSSTSSEYGQLDQREGGSQVRAQRGAEQEEAVPPANRKSTPEQDAALVIHLMHCRGIGTALNRQLPCATDFSDAKPYSYERSNGVMLHESAALRARCSTMYYVDRAEHPLKIKFSAEKSCTALISIAEISEDPKKNSDLGSTILRYGFANILTSPTLATNITYCTVHVRKGESGGYLRS